MCWILFSVSELLFQCRPLSFTCPSLFQEHPDSVRSREMKELYGAAAPRLHAMETAVQLAFERVATRRHTKLWPNIPINVIFEDAS